MSADRLFDSPAPMAGQLGLEREDAEAADSFAVEHVPLGRGQEIDAALDAYWRDLRESSYPA